MNDKVRFDKAFWDYQQMFKERTEPRHGDLFIPEFHNSMLVSNQQPNFVYNQSIYQQAGSINLVTVPMQKRAIKWVLAMNMGASMRMGNSME